MRLEVLFSGLENPQPAVRLDVVRVLGMLDETRALDKLRDCYAHESDPAVKQAIAWAGKRLYQAQQAGYSTVDELFRHFGIDREIQFLPDAEEARLIEQLNQGFERDLLNNQTRMSRRKVGMAAAAALGGTLLGGTSMGMLAFTDAMRPGAEVASSNLGVSGVSGRRTPATAPSNADIAIWVRRLHEAPTPDMREQAAIELATLNNPKALPHLAAAFLRDSSPKVRQAAQRYGKVLYWSTVYWDMEQDGSLVAEMQRRAALLDKTLRVQTGGAAPGTPSGAPQAAAPDAPAARPPSGPEPSPVDVGEILRKAHEGRAARKRKDR